MKILPFQPKSNFDIIKGFVRIVHENATGKITKAKSSNIKLKHRG